MRCDTPVRVIPASRPRVLRGRLLCAALCTLTPITAAWAAPHLPASDAEVLAVLPPGAAHTSAPVRELARARLDVALPLAQFYIGQARATGDLRYLGYAEATLAPWQQRSPPLPAVLVLDATILQSRHAFDAALSQLDRALETQPDDAQAWLTRATVLRVLGRYDEATSSCERLAPAADADITSLCIESMRGLTGHLHAAYATIESLPQQLLSIEARAWRYSELGEMAERLGNDAQAEHWFREGLQLAPSDAYMRTACADLLLREARSADAIRLLSGYESMEPMLLRIVIAQRLQRSADAQQSQALLAGAFAIEQQRGDAVHRREQARFLLDIEQRPQAALEAAQQNWQMQREPDDLLILLRAAQAAHRPDAAGPAVQFIRQHGIEDVRLEPYIGEHP